ncbi:hypothetical protein TNCV_2058271 [Trichonephila clavipes]|nr:hypothetical protein TNCV_2058271 [Trichonephila clavipes]
MMSSLFNISAHPLLLQGPSQTRHSSVRIKLPGKKACCFLQPYSLRYSDPLRPLTLTGVGPRDKVRPPLTHPPVIPFPRRNLNSRIFPFTSGSFSRFRLSHSQSRKNRRNSKSLGSYGKRGLAMKPPRPEEVKSMDVQSPYSSIVLKCGE